MRLDDPYLRFGNEESRVQRRKADPFEKNEMQRRKDTESKETEG
jgi:hypothetical protein